MDASYVKHLSPLRLARLLKLTVESVWTEHDGIAALRHQLESPLLPDLAATKDLDAHELEAFLRTYRGPITFGAQLTEEAPSVTLLLAIKQFSKQMGGDPANPLSKNAAMILYFASIAAALSRCRQRISKMTDIQLREGFDWAMAQPGAESLQLVFKAGTSTLASTPAS